MKTGKLVSCVISALFAVACGGSGGSGSAALRVDSIDPSCVVNPTGPTKVTVAGNMPVSPVVNINNPGSSSVNTTYNAWINGEQLASVTRVDGSRLTADVPAMLAGTYALQVQGPVGNPVTKDNFFQVSNKLCPTKSASLLVTAATATPATLVVGDTVTVSATVQNNGLTTADSVLPTITSAPPGLSVATNPSPQTLEKNASQTFAFTYKATGAGNGTFDIGATGTANDTHQTITAPPVPTNPVLVNPQSSLTANTTVSSATASAGQNFQVTFTVTNWASSDSTVTPTMAATGPQQQLKTGPSAFSVPSGSSHAFVWTYTATQAGTSSYAVSATATEASGPAATVQTAPVTVTVQAGATLATAVKVNPATVAGGGNAATTVLATVTNTGAVTANNVAASIASAPAGVTPPSALPGPQSIPGGTSANFTWLYTVGASPGGNFSVTAQGTDANSAAPVAAPAATGALVVTYPLGVTVVGLTGTGLVVSDGTDTISPPATTTFPTQLASGTKYTVAVTTQPSGQSCSVSGNGTIGVGPATATVTCCTGGPFALNITVVPVGAGSVQCGSPAAACTASYACSSTPMPLTAVPATGYTFSGWSGACTGLGACSVTMNSTESVTATFVALPTTDAGTPDAGTATGAVQ